MSRRRISWSEFPPEILFVIAGRLETRTDILHFRSVCKKWRASATFSLLSNKNIISPLLPHNLLSTTPPLLFLRGNPTQRIFCSILLGASSVFLLRSTLNPKLPPWLITVEELNSGKLFIREPLSRFDIESIPECFKKILDSSHFQKIEIGRFYAVRLREIHLENLSWRKWSYFYNKVVLYVDPHCKRSHSPTIKDCIALVLYENGILATIGLNNEQEKVQSFSHVWKFDDVVEFKGMIYVIDRKGRVYCMSYLHLALWNIVDKPVSEAVANDRRKRLVESCGELFLIYRCHERCAKVDFKVFKLNEEQKKWDVVDGIGDDRILFVTLDGCFFVAVKDLPEWRGNCIAFYRNSFPTYNDSVRFDRDIFKTQKKTELDIAIFHFVSGDCGPVASYPGYADVFWPSAEWLSSDSNLTIGDSQKDVETQKDSFITQKCLESSSTNETSYPPDIQVDIQAKDNHSLTNIRENLSVGGITTNLELNTPSATESLETVVSKTKFQRVDVSSDLLPTLTRIWAKHGNVLEGPTVRSNDLIAWSLESMAKVAVLLENTSGRSFNDSEADYLSSTICDLQLMRLNVSWLVPSVVKALYMHKVLAKKENLEETLNEIEKVTTQVTDMKTKFIAEVGGLEQMLDEQRKSVCESLTLLDCPMP